MDYCFPRAGGEATETVLVLRERPHRMTMSTIVPMKGASVEWCVRRVLAFIKEIGLEGNDIVLKPDQEPAIVSLMTEIAARRKAKTIPEHLPVASSQSNGYVERAIQSVSGQARVMLDALEARVGQSCRGSGTAALAWLIEHASVLWNRYAVSSDGKTAYERLRGKKSRVLGVEFGEKVHWRRAIPSGQRNNKLGSVWMDGVYLVHKTLSGESIVGNKEGVFRTRTIRRVPVEDRWRFELIQEVAGVPWKCSPQSDEAEQVVQDAVQPSPSDSPVMPPEPPHVVCKEEAPWRLYVKTDLLKQIGYTPGCPGCRALQTRRTRVGHSDECRKRAVDAMKDTAIGRERITAAKRREDEFLARAFQESDEKLIKRARSAEDSNADKPNTVVPGDGGAGNGIVASPQDASMSTVPADNNVDTPMSVLSVSSSSGAVGPVNIASSSSSQSMPGLKRSRDPADDGDQDLHRDGDIGMSSLAICECPAAEDFRSDLVPEVFSVDYDGVLSVAESCDSTGIGAVVGAWEEEVCGADEPITLVPSNESLKTKFDPEQNRQRIVPAAILPTFTEWSDEGLFDDLTGEILPADLVKAAKKEELSEMYRRSVWTEVSVADSMEATGRPPIPVRWVITNKGDSSNYNVRARLVAKHIVAKYGGKGIHDLFAAVPPFEMMKLLLVRAVTGGISRGPVPVSGRARGVRKRMFIDVSKAHLYAPVDVDVDTFVDLPRECRKEGVCGKLNYWLYGMRPASRGWETEYTKKLKDLGFTPGKASPCCFHRSSDGISVVVHGDDFVFEGCSDAFPEIVKKLSPTLDY